MYGPKNDPEEVWLIAAIVALIFAAGVCLGVLVSRWT